MELSFFSSVSTDRILSVSLSFRVWIPEKLASMFFENNVHLNGWYKSGVSIKLYVLKGKIVWFFVKINFSFSNAESTPKLLNISIAFLSPWIEFCCNPLSFMLQLIKKCF